VFVVSAIVSVLTWASLEAELSTPPKIILAIVSVLTWASLKFGVFTPPPGADGLLPGGNGGPGGPALLFPGAGGLPPGAGGAFDSEKEKGKRVKKTERLNNVL
jgi:hypothetical protein